MWRHAVYMIIRHPGMILILTAVCECQSKQPVGVKVTQKHPIIAYFFLIRRIYRCVDFLPRLPVVFSVVRIHTLVKLLLCGSTYQQQWESWNILAYHQAARTPSQNECERAPSGGRYWNACSSEVGPHGDPRNSLIKHVRQTKFRLLFTLRARIFPDVYIYSRKLTKLPVNRPHVWCKDRLQRETSNVLLCNICQTPHTRRDSTSHKLTTQHPYGWETRTATSKRTICHI